MHPPLGLILWSFHFRFRKSITLYGLRAISSLSIGIFCPTQRKHRMKSAQRPSCVYAATNRGCSWTFPKLPECHLGWGASWLQCFQNKRSLGTSDSDAVRPINRSQSPLFGASTWRRNPLIIVMTCSFQMSMMKLMCRWKSHRLWNCGTSESNVAYPNANSKTHVSNRNSHRLAQASHTRILEPPPQWVARSNSKRKTEGDGSILSWGGNPRGNAQERWPDFERWRSGEAKRRNLFG